MTHEKLKPCPHCGEAKALNTHVVRDRTGDEVCVVFCGRCGAKGPRPDLPVHYSDESGDIDTRCVDEAIAAWNRRAGDAI